MAQSESLLNDPDIFFLFFVFFVFDIVVRYSVRLKVKVIKIQVHQDLFLVWCVRKNTTLI